MPVTLAAVLPFDADMAARMEALYSKGDVVRRRRLAREALPVEPGERILAVGCAPGFLAPVVLGDVGPSGGLVGVDLSEAMLAVAADRCAGHPDARFLPGDATALPVEDGGFDRAICVQVLEYVADVAAALRELHRVLRPGGRLVVWDIDWPTLSWGSGDPGRMARVLRAWDAHLAHPSLPSVLAPRLRTAGVTDVRLSAHAFASIDLEPDRFASLELEVVADYVAGRPEIGEAEARAWHDEQVELARRGETWFAVTQCCFTATRT